MNKFKDFLYDKSDILIALAILLIAALVIAWRLGAIVEYPKEIIDENNNSTEYNTDTPVEENNSENANEGASEENSTEAPADQPAPEGESENTTPPENTQEETPVQDALWSSEGLLTKDVTVSWSGGSASALIQCAVDAGLFESYEEYETICLNQGITDPEQVPVWGTSTFKAGSSKADIALQIKK